MQAKVRGIHDKAHRQVLGIVDLEIMGHILLHSSLRVTGNTVQAREELAQERIYEEING